MPFTVLVTGASGYIAGHVVQQLLAAGHEVRGTVRNVKDEAKVQHLYDLCPESRDRLRLVEADLLDEKSWLPAVEGVDHVIHLASPNPNTPPEPSQEETVMAQIVDGTMNVLKACVQTPSVRRIVLTSSAVVVNWSTSNTGKAHTEEDWSNIADLDLMATSKLKAERAAWDFMKSLPDDSKLELVVINPSITLGPPLHSRQGTSTELLHKLLDRLIPAVPKMDFPIADVRDVAQAHLQALTVPEAAGHRHIIYSGNMWMSEMAHLLKFVFESQGYSIPTLVAPNLVMRMAGKMDDSVKPILPYLGVIHQYNNTRMREVLSLEPRNIRDTVVDMAHAMIQQGLAHRTSKYAGPGSLEDREKYLALKL